MVACAPHHVLFKSTVPNSYQVFCNFYRAVSESMSKIVSDRSIQSINLRLATADISDAMKLNSTVALTLVLLALMVGAGLVSAAWGIALGRDALKGVTQPDTRPTNNLAKRQGTAARREEFTILREEDIVASAKARINGTAKTSAPAVTKLASNSDAGKTKFPIVSQSENLVMEVNSAQKQGTP